MSEFKIHGLSAEGEAYRAALVAIQELHGRDTYGCCLHCLSDDGWSVKFPCPTRRLADDALGGNNNG